MHNILVLIGYVDHTQKGTGIIDEMLRDISMKAT